MAASEEILSLLKTLMEYYDHKLSDNQARIYLATLSDVPADVLQKAAYDHIAANKWFPKVAELRQAAHAIRENAGRPIKYDDDPGGVQRNRELYWLAMVDFNSKTDLDKSKPWKWFEKRAEWTDIEAPELEPAHV